MHSHLPSAFPPRGLCLDKFLASYICSTGILSSAGTYETVPGPFSGERVERKESLSIRMVNSTGTFVKLYLENSSEL